jgi:opacity protein-like surface antigen
MTWRSDSMVANGAGARRASPAAACMAAWLVVLLATIGAAKADEFNDNMLRGSFEPRIAPPSYARWSGVYFGGQLGMSSATVNYSQSTSGLSDYILRNSVLQDDVSSMQTMGNDTRTHTNFGGFVGYNFELTDGIVLGGELNYSKVGLRSSVQDSLTRIIPNDEGAPTGHHYYYTTTVTGQASMNLKDVVSLRARAAYEIGQFLPYAFAGLAIGRADYLRQVTVNYTTADVPDAGFTAAPPPNFGPVSNTDAGANAIAYGSAVGLGFDVSLLPNVFLRAEWEYIYFVPLHQIQMSLNTGRVGIGFKF